MASARKETLCERLLAVVESQPDRTAIADSSGACLSYAKLVREAGSVANWLAETRVLETNIGLFLPASVGAAIANYGITLAGKVAVNLNFTSGIQNCRIAAEVCELRTILTSRSFITKLGIEAPAAAVFLEDVPKSAASLPHAAITPDSSACILFSSGSTGIPKGIELTHWNILANTDGLASRIPLAPDDCALGVLPFFHSFGYTFALWFPVLHGLRAAYHGNPTDCRIIGDLAKRHAATFFFSTPTFCQQYVRKIEPPQFASLRYVIVGAEKLRESVARDFRSHFAIDLLAGYGCTELGPGVAINSPAESKRGSVGRPLKDIEIRIADVDTLKPLPVGQPGMILVNGPSRMPGYYRAPEMTRDAIRDGFYVTGDIGYVDEDGFLYVADRLARFSKIAGEMAPHLPIEEAIADLTSSFVTGVADDWRGERLVLLYTNAETTPEALHERLYKAALPPLWIPKKEDMHHVDAIPVLATGKVDLQRARKMAVEAAS